ncbi:MAG: helix-turn-helix domain-containing protein [Firmicutes bacterium]|nr:helix-turn-helix domain-containing protein [Bacillota bacterium]MDD7601287.1 helix-turn-helix domain-containing protein [Bacillota bacterium]MDY5856466.1 helix-turn-helix domain-containing protein [Anaerovoracaceae bacterium]
MNQKKKELNSKMVRSSLGSYISAARKQKNLSQEELAELAELSTNHISKLERGCNNARFETVMRIFRVLDLSMDAFIYSDAFGETEAEGYRQRMEREKAQDEKLRLKEAISQAIDHVYEES